MVQRFLHTLAVGGVPQLLLLLLHYLHLVWLDFVTARAFLNAHCLDHRSLLLLFKKLVSSFLLIIYRLLDEIIHQFDRQVSRFWYASLFLFSERILNWTQGFAPSCW